MRMNYFSVQLLMVIVLFRKTENNAVKLLKEWYNYAREQGKKMAMN